MTAIDLIDGLVRWEGCRAHLYLDTKGFPTTGIGHLVKTVFDCQRLDWRLPDGQPASPALIEKAFLRVQEAPAGKKASFYATLTDLRLTETFCRRLAAGRLADEFLPGIRKLIPGFDDLPKPAQECLVDVAWNVGVSGFARFKRLITACNAGNWEAAAKSCSVKTSRDERNDWRRDQFISCTQTQS